MYRINSLNSVLITAIFILALTSCKKDLEDDKQYAEEVLIEKYLLGKKYSYTKVSGVYSVIVTASDLTQVEKGKNVAFWYKGYTLDGKVFDTNIKTEAILAKLDTNVRVFDSLVVKAGVGKLIKGLDIGLLQLKEGEKAIILFPSVLGYGDDMMGSLKPWTSLVFDVEIVDVE